MAFRTIGVLGGGAWGTALALAAVENSAVQRMWMRSEANADAINDRHENQKRLPGVMLPESISAVTSLSALQICDAIVSVTPAQATREVLKEAAPFIAGKPLILCSKGLERLTVKTMSEVYAETLGEPAPAVLSGPSFAVDVAKGLPTAVTIACADAALGDKWMTLFGSRKFRPYLTDDVIGVELNGAVKNVLAIACGAVAGMGLGESARAALIARGVAELGRLSASMGGRSETLAGLSGLGDIVLTCSSAQSRNFAFGQRLGGGESFEDAREKTGLVEGAASAEPIAALARSKSVEMPVTEAVAAVVSGETTLQEAVSALLERPFKRES